MRRALLDLVLVGALSTIPGSAATQEAFPTGEVVERVVALADSAEAYALYLPTAFDPGRTWPVLFLLDPRGRALVPMELYREPAERYGYVVLSAYGSRSDAGPEPTERALQALLDDAQAHFAPDTRRLYLVGFSGTARQAWDYARRLGGAVAGVIGFGAAFPTQTAVMGFDLIGGPAFSYFGGSGTGDFNYEELRAVRETLEPHGIPSQVRFWPGGHGWPPAEVAGASVEWMEVHAQRTGLAPPDPAWLQRTFADELAEAAALGREGRPLEARERYVSLRHAFDGVAELALLDARLEALEASDAYREAARDAERFAAMHRERTDALYALLRNAWNEDTTLDVERTAEALEIEELRRRMERADGAEAAAVRRVLESFMVQLSFYMPRNWIEVGEGDRALASLALADRVFPERVTGLCRFRALAHALEERADETLEQVRCLAAGFPAAAAALLRDSRLGFVAADPRYRALLEEVEAARRRGSGGPNDPL